MKVNIYSSLMDALMREARESKCSPQTIMIKALENHLEDDMKNDGVNNTNGNNEKR